MMLLSSHILDKLENWDTNWARKALKIPQDQLSQIDNIPEWSTNQTLITENTASAEAHIITTEKAPLLHCATAFKRLSKTNSSLKYTDNRKASNLLQNIESKLTRSASLNYLNLFDKPSEHIGLKSADSVPNIKLVLSSDNISIPETVSQKPKTSKLSIFNPNKKSLKDTSIVFEKLNKMNFCSTSFSQPDMNYGSIPESIKPIEKLTDRILNHRYLKESVNSTKPHETEPFEVSVEEEGNPNILDKRLTLLEKRFSSSEECASAGKSSKIQELSEPIFQAPKDAELQVQDCVPIAVSCASDGQIQGPLSSAVIQEPDLNAIREKDNEPNYGQSSCSNKAVTPSVPINNESITMGVNHEETFGSQIIPCGQPLPVEASSCSQTQKTNTETCNVPIDATPSAAAKNVDIQKSPAVRDRVSGTKRKRKSKGETPKRLKDAHAFNFTADQVRNMLELIKMFHSS